MARLTKPWSQAERDYLNRYIRADFETGLLYWKEGSPNGRYKVGDSLNTSLAGLPSAQYLIFAVYNLSPHQRQKNFKVHHVIWFLKHGRQSELWLDHKNQVKTDNRLDNLREATISQNAQNASPKGDARLKGVYKSPRAHRKLWSTIRVNGTSFHLGSFDTEQQAALAYDRAAICLHDEFASLNFPDVTHTPQQLKLMRDYLAMKRNKQPVSQAA